MEDAISATPKDGVFNRMSCCILSRSGEMFFPWGSGDEEKGKDGMEQGRGGEKLVPLAGRKQPYAEKPWPNR